MSRTLPVSVVIPHFNRSDLVRVAVESVRNQTMPPAEIIVVDDCSSTEHQAELRKFVDVRVLFSERNGGAATARSAGVAACTHPWVAFLDDDDQWMPDKLERQWAVLQATPNLAGTVTAITVISDSRPPWNLHSHSPQIMTLGAALEDNPAFLQTALLRTADTRNVGLFDPTLRICDDQDFWIRFVKAGHQVYVLSEPLAKLNRRRIKRVTNFWRQRVAEQFQIIEKYRDLYRAEYGPGAVRRAQYKSICRSALEIGRVTGRLLYGWGCVHGRDWRRLTKLATTGRMEIIPYSGD